MKEKEAAQLLGECEENLRRLAAEAVRAGDYPGVLRITDWAKAIAALVAEARSGQEVAGTTHSMVSANRNVPAKERSYLRAVVPDLRRKRPTPDDYPKFFRRGDELVKVGWSKKDRKEYNHRAPRKAVDAIAGAVRQAGAKGKLFNGDSLLPLKDLSNGEAVPDYQAYVALAWLKHLGLVEQRGRRAGYTLVPLKQIDSAITAAWPELAEWRG